MSKFMSCVSQDELVHWMNIHHAFRLRTDSILIVANIYCFHFCDNGGEDSRFHDLRDHIGSQRLAKEHSVDQCRRMHLPYSAHPATLMTEWRHRDIVIKYSVSECFNFCSAAHTPVLLPNHRNRRLVWVEEEMKWVQYDWRRVIRPDKSSFSLADNGGALGTSRERKKSNSETYDPPEKVENMLSFGFGDYFLAGGLHPIFALNSTVHLVAFNKPSLDDCNNQRKRMVWTLCSEKTVPAPAQSVHDMTEQIKSTFAPTAAAITMSASQSKIEPLELFENQAHLNSLKEREAVLKMNGRILALV